MLTIEERIVRRWARWRTWHRVGSSKPCEVCGNPKTQAHHPDYNEPDTFQWLCSLHHAQAHLKTVPPPITEETLHRAVLELPMRKGRPLHQYLPEGSLNWTPKRLKAKTLQQAYDAGELKVITSPTTGS